MTAADGLDTRPTIDGERVRLRPFTGADVPRLVELLADDAIPANVPTIPSPYEPSDAEAWIGRHVETWETGAGLELAIETRGAAALIGAVGLRIARVHASAETGYWIGQPYRGRGYAVDAARALLRYAFGELGLHRVHAHHLMGNPASGAVLRKVGMRPEGVLRQCIRHRGQYHDAVLFAILRGDPEAATL